MTLEPTRPPRDISPSDFFERWLPEQLAQAPRSQADLVVRVRLEGDDGGIWDLRVTPGGLAVTPTDASSPADVTILQSVADWRAIAVGEAGAIDLAPPQASPLDLLFLDPQAQSLLGTVKGTVRFEVTGYNGRTWMLTVKFGQDPSPPDPTATISVDAETYAGILARTIAPPQAFFSGKVKLAGDAALAMQLGMAMMPRFS